MQSSLFVSYFMKPAIKPGHLAVLAIYICSCLGLFVVCLSEVSAMDETVLPAPIPRGRWKEDWSILPVPDLTLDDPSLYFKRVPLNESGTNYMSFGGEYRLAYEIHL